jgi:hypothetical protein
MKVTKSESIAALAQALAKAQAQVMQAHRDAQNPHYRSTYATIEAVLDAIREPLAQHGIAFCQFPGTHWVEGRLHLALTTILMHSSGECLEGVLEIPVAKTDAQGVASATTYARRIALQAILGVAAEDDDGNGAVGKPAAGIARSEAPVRVAKKELLSAPLAPPPAPTGATPATPPPTPVRRVSEERLSPEELEARAGRLGFVSYEGQKKAVGGLWSAVKRANASKSALKLFLLERYGVDSTYELTNTQARDSSQYLDGVARGIHPALVEPGGE